MEYLQNPPQADGCLFCRLIQQVDSPENLIVHRALHSFVVLNRFPYTSGHMMIAPTAHVASPEGMDPAALHEIMDLSRRALGILRAEYGAENFNLGSNIGEVAGAGVRDHFHMHVLPRWTGDTNFMATTADTRVLPETLDETFLRMSRAWSSPKTGSA